MLSTNEAVLSKANQELEYSCKTVNDLELSLSEAQKGWKEAEDSLWEIHHENFEISKEYEKSLEDSFSMLDVYFENAL